MALAALTAFGASSQQQSTPVLWRDPGSIAEKDLFWGAGSADRQPQPPFTFLKEDLSGSKPKVRVTDSRGVEWNVKFAGEMPEKNEVHCEIAASRLFWAFGYIVEEHYFVPTGTIAGVAPLQRARMEIKPDGSFRTARFERREPNAERTGRRWSFDNNPFVGTKELSGLQILTALVNNWDNKHFNTAIEAVTFDHGHVEDHYLMSDLGATFGRMAGPPWRPAPTRWNVQHYQEQPLIAGVRDGQLLLFFKGQVPLSTVPLEHARWFSDMAGQLSVTQVHRAFEAAGATPSEADGFAKRAMQKIDDLKAATQALSSSRR